MRNELSRLGRAGVKAAGCIDGTTTTTVPRTGTAASLCAAGRIQRTRHAACGVTGIAYRVIRIPGGQVIGTGTIAFAYSSALSNRSRSWQLPAAIELTSATGVVRVGTTATTAISCTGGCRSSGPWVTLLRVGKVATHTFGISAGGSGTVTTRQAPVVELVNPAATRQAPPSKLGALGPARCDSVAVARSSGCVFSDVAGTYVLHLHGQNVDQVAAHIAAAQKGKPHHFGWFGHGRPLTRATSAAIQRRNRARACGGKRVPGKTCDEYPFAATFQGASFFPGDSSIAFVPGSQNSAEGGLRVAMYRNERLLNNDPYWVFIVP